MPNLVTDVSVGFRAAGRLHTSLCNVEVFVFRLFRLICAKKNRKQ